MVSATVAQCVDLLQPVLQHLGIVDTQSSCNAVLMAPLQDLKVLGENPEVPRFDDDPEGHGFVVLPVPFDTVFSTAVNLLCLPGLPLIPGVALSSASVLPIGGLLGVYEARIQISQRIVVPNLMSNYRAHMNFDALDGIEHQLAKLFVEEIEVERRIEGRARHEGVLAKRLLSDAAEGDLAVLIPYKLSCRKPESTQSIVAHLRKLALSPLGVCDLHSATGQEFGQVAVGSEWLRWSELSQLPCPRN